jgi:hypothetical protein
MRLSCRGTHAVRCGEHVAVKNERKTSKHLFLLRKVETTSRGVSRFVAFTFRTQGPMLARWLPAAAVTATRRVACRASKANASRTSWTHPLANARPRLVRAYAAGGWRISDDLSGGNGGGGRGDENDDGPSRDRAGSRDRTAGGRSARPASRGYEGEQRGDEYGSPGAARRGGRGGGRGRGRDEGAREFRDDFGRDAKRSGGARGGRGGRGGRSSSGNGGFGRTDSNRGAFPPDQFDTRQNGRDYQSPRERGNDSDSFYGGKRAATEFDGDDAFGRPSAALKETPTPTASSFRNSDPLKRNDTGQNDWTCLGCGGLNFARRGSCFKCGAQKGDASGSRVGRGPINFDNFPEKRNGGNGSHDSSEQAYRGVAPDEGVVNDRDDRRIDGRDDRRIDGRDDRRFDRSRDRDGQNERQFDTKNYRGGRGGQGDRCNSDFGESRGDKWDVGRRESKFSQTQSRSSDERRKPLAPGYSRFYVTCHPGLESAVAAELSSYPINASDVTAGASGVYFVGTTRTGVLANVWLRRYGRRGFPKSGGTTFLPPRS